MWDAVVCINRAPVSHDSRTGRPGPRWQPPADHFGADSRLRALYEWPAFAPFIQEALGEARFHRYADPLADVIVNLVEEGGGFPWHFDTNNYTVTLAIQNAEHGGDFEYSPYLHTPADENYDGVARVLDGDPSLIRTLRLDPVRAMWRSSATSKSPEWWAVRSALASCMGGCFLSIWSAPAFAPMRSATEGRG